MKKMNKQNIETIVLENSKTGETLELQHEQHKAEYGAKHFWKADKKFFELLSAFSAAESKVLAYILQKTQPTKNEFIGACKTIARKLNCDVTTVRSTFKKMAEKDTHWNCRHRNLPKFLQGEVALRQGEQHCMQRKQ